MRVVHFSFRCPTQSLPTMPLLALLVLGFAAGCAAKAERIAERATPTGVEATLHMLAEEENRQLLVDLTGELAAELASETTVRGLTRGAVGGAMDSFADEQAAQQLANLLRNTADALLEGIARGLERHIQPRLAALIDTSIDQTIESLTRPQRLERIERALEQTTRTATTALGATLAEATVEEIGPAVQTTLRRHVGPGLQEALPSDLERVLSPQVQDELQTFAADASRLIAREIVLGMRDAVEQARAAGEPVELPGTARIGGWLDRGIGLAVILAIVLALAAGVLALILGIVLSRARRARIASEWRLATALLLTQLLRAADGRQLDPELVDRLVQDLRESDEPETIIHTLRDRIASAPRAGEHAARGKD